MARKKISFEETQALKLGLEKSYLPIDPILRERDIKVFNMNHMICHRLSCIKGIEQVAFYLNLPAGSVFRSYERLGLGLTTPARSRWSKPRFRLPLLHEDDE